jgi:glycosyltransferase involved in cell wall biosynthesis
MASYGLNLELIANSTWLVQKLRQEVSSEALLCNNAIDHSVFYGEPKTGHVGEEVRIISYGGRSLRWKGFIDMAAAIRLVRETLPDVAIRWQVYGASALDPSNSIATYEPLGFLNSKDLAAAYRRADILLSASWYESFPLFPLEAMACGLPAVTTQFGTEDFAVPGVTAEVVKPKDPKSIADGLMRLITDHSHRSAMAECGHEISKKFNWNSSVSRMECILLQPPS